MKNGCPVASARPFIVKNTFDKNNLNENISKPLWVSLPRVSEPYGSHHQPLLSLWSRRSSVCGRRLSANSSTSRSLPPSALLSPPCGVHSPSLPLCTERTTLAPMYHTEDLRKEMFSFLILVSFYEWLLGIMKKYVFCISILLWSNIHSLLDKAQYFQNKTYFSIQVLTIFLPFSMSCRQRFPHSESCCA